MRRFTDSLEGLPWGVRELDEVAALAAAAGFPREAVVANVGQQPLGRVPPVP
jgi:hypothetical protein